MMKHNNREYIHKHAFSITYVIKAKICAKIGDLNGDNQALMNAM